MAQTVLALGATTVTASGCVWYLPALADLRAGPDRPVSRRRAAAACVSGWSTGGVIAVLLLLAEAWWIPCAAAAAGMLLTAGLRIGAAVARRTESRESARHWGELGPVRPSPPPDRSRYVVAVLFGTGLVAATVAAVLRVPGG
ncbi:hypothetical protein ABZX95_31495 [Streptomyces sp. NPDC004232]|uniref:hypothetical protein n=1 Tax=Streptomyces sp. NPDC004232 TaxID=3154454 RepID=UPI0033AC6622